MISERAVDRLSIMFRQPDLTGTRYELLAELGRGGMGIVYLARDTTLNREVALKIVEPADDAARGAAAAMLAHEARILARLEHPGIVPVHDLGELPDGRVFYAMKRVRGERFDRWVGARVDLAERLTVFLRICDAVAFAHAHGIVHRDLKPENVMIGEFGEVLVLDWGIAVNAERGMRNAEYGINRSEHEPDSALVTAETPSVTSDSALATPDCAFRTPHSASATPDSALRTPHSALRGRAAGTPAYMSPEQRAGGAVDHRTDVYALGVVLDAIGGGAPLAAIARKACAAAPADRYQTVGDLAADVQRYLSGRAVAAHREPILDRVQRLYRRHRVPILLVLTYLAVRLLLLWIGRI